MAELLGVAASIIQIAGTGAKLSIALYDFIGSAARADQEITDIAGDVELTSNVLDSVGRVFETEDAQSIVSKKAIQDANSLIRRCGAVFNDISEVVEKRRRVSKDGKRSLSMMGKLAWPLKEQRIELLRRRMESLKNSLMLLLHVLQLAQGQARGNLEKGALDEERRKIRELHQRQQDSLQDLQALEKKLSNFNVEDDETLQGSNMASRTPSFEKISIAQHSKDAPLDAEAQVQVNANNTAMEIFAANDSDAVDANAVTSDEEGESLTLEELDNCAKHVRKLLDHITALQRGFGHDQAPRVYKKRRMHKLYMRFRQEFEADISEVSTASVPALIDNPVNPVAGMLGPGKTDTSTHVTGEVTFGCTTPQPVPSGTIDDPGPTMRADIASQQSQAQQLEAQWQMFQRQMFQRYMQVQKQQVQQRQAQQQAQSQDQQLQVPWQIYQQHTQAQLQAQQKAQQMQIQRQQFMQQQAQLQGQQQQAQQQRTQQQALLQQSQQTQPRAEHMHTWQQRYMLQQLAQSQVQQQQQQVQQQQAQQDGDIQDASDVEDYINSLGVRAQPGVKRLRNIISSPNPDAAPPDQFQLHPSQAENDLNISEINASDSPDVGPAMGMAAPILPYDSEYASIKPSWMDSAPHLSASPRDSPRNEENRNIFNQGSSPQHLPPVPMAEYIVAEGSHHMEADESQLQPSGRRKIPQSGEHMTPCSARRGRRAKRRRISVSKDRSLERDATQKTKDGDGGIASGLEEGERDVVDVLLEQWTVPTY